MREEETPPGFGSGPTRKHIGQSVAPRYMPSSGCLGCSLTTSLDEALGRLLCVLEELETTDAESARVPDWSESELSCG